MMTTETTMTNTSKTLLLGSVFHQCHDQQSVTLHKLLALPDLFGKCHSGCCNYQLSPFHMSSRLICALITGTHRWDKLLVSRDVSTLRLCLPICTLPLSQAVRHLNSSVDVLRKQALPNADLWIGPSGRSVSVVGCDGLRIPLRLPANEACTICTIKGGSTTPAF